MYDENQLVEIKWSNKMRGYYESKGYVFTNYGDTFFVKAKDLTKYSKAKIKVICDFCKKEYTTLYCDYNAHEDKTVDACNDCRAYKQWAKTKNKRAIEKFDLLRKNCKENDYELITQESEYTNVFMPIKYICKKHGLQTQSLDALTYGHKCYFCSYEERGKNKMHSKEYVESVINSINGNILLNPEEYKGVFEKNLRIKCGECGDEYITDFDSYVRQNQTRCPHCSKSESIGEFRIRKFLENYKINFIQEKKFDNCIDKKRLPFDFYLPDYNLIVEFDGQMHYYDVGYGNHEMTVRHDKIKNKYCDDNNIKLLRIPYWNGNNIEEILTKELNL